MANEVKCWCQHCKKELPPSHTGPCPHCGKTGKDYKVTLRDKIGIAASLIAQKTHKYTKKHPLFIGISVVFTIISLSVGYLLGAWAGLLIGIIVAMLNWWITPHAMKTIVEITHLGNKERETQEAKVENDAQKPDYSHKGIYRRLEDIENKIDSTSRTQKFVALYALGVAFIILGFSQWPDFLQLIGIDSSQGSILPVGYITLGSITLILARFVSRPRQEVKKRQAMGTKGRKNIKKPKQ